MVEAIDENEGYPLVGEFWLVKGSPTDVMISLIVGEWVNMAVHAPGLERSKAHRSKARCVEGYLRYGDIDISIPNEPHNQYKIFGRVIG